MMKPLSNLLKKKLSFEWKEEEQRVFEDLKKKLSSTFMLKFLDFTKPFKVHMMRMISLSRESSCKMDIQLFLRVRSFMEHNYDGRFMKRSCMPWHVDSKLGNIT